MMGMARDIGDSGWRGSGGLAVVMAWQCRKSSPEKFSGDSGAAGAAVVVAAENGEREKIMVHVVHKGRFPNIPFLLRGVTDKPEGFACLLSSGSMLMASSECEFAQTSDKCAQTALPYLQKWMVAAHELLVTTFSCYIASCLESLAGASDVDVLLGGILSNIRQHVLRMISQFFPLKVKREIALEVRGKA
ncbi:hypothetical protein Tco_0703636 [Tanacetum coccineum]|uniref:Uncharacterized protein n=1 Tax=Tanacetum coccineum TaxID=301880 RepID=A0ABQ4Y167_9ASTR